MNRKLFFNPEAAENSSRFVEAGFQTDRVVAKYGKRFLTVSAHSQGGGISSLIAQKKDIAGFHFNPAISSKQVAENASSLKTLKSKLLIKHISILLVLTPILKEYNAIWMLN